MLLSDDDTTLHLELHAGRATVVARGSFGVSAADTLAEVLAAMPAEVAQVLVDFSGVTHADLMGMVALRDLLARHRASRHLAVVAGDLSVRAAMVLADVDHVAPLLQDGRDADAVLSGAVAA